MLKSKILRMYLRNDYFSILNSHPIVKIELNILICNNRHRFYLQDKVIYVHSSWTGNIYKIVNPTTNIHKL